MDDTLNVNVMLLYHYKNWMNKLTNLKKRVQLVTKIYAKRVPIDSITINLFRSNINTKIV